MYFLVNEQVCIFQILIDIPRLLLESLSKFTFPSVMDPGSFPHISLVALVNVCQSNERKMDYCFNLLFHVIGEISI